MRCTAFQVTLSDLECHYFRRVNSMSSISETVVLYIFGPVYVVRLPTNRPRPRPYCVRWEPSSPRGKGHITPTLRPMSIVAKPLLISATAELLLKILYRFQRRRQVKYRRSSCKLATFDAKRCQLSSVASLWQRVVRVCQQLIVVIVSLHVIQCPKNNMRNK